MEIWLVEDIKAEATAFYYFYLPVLAPSCDPRSLHVLQEAREFLNNLGKFKARTREGEVFISQVGILARTRAGKELPLEILSRQGAWSQRYETAVRNYEHYVREMRSTREFLDPLMEEECCNCTLRCMPDPEPSSSTRNSV